MTAPRPLSDDEIADLILRVSDLLDPVSGDPQVTVIRESGGTYVYVHVRIKLETLAALADRLPAPPVSEPSEVSEPPASQDVLP